MADEINRQSALAKAQRNADKALRAAHTDEWNTLMTKAAYALGIDWKPPVSAEEKAAAQIAELLAKNPGLRDRFTRDEEITLDLDA